MQATFWQIANRIPLSLNIIQRVIPLKFAKIFLKKSYHYFPYDFQMLKHIWWDEVFEKLLGGTWSAELQRVESSSSTVTNWNYICYYCCYSTPHFSLLFECLVRRTHFSKTVAAAAIYISSMISKE